MRIFITSNHPPGLASVRELVAHNGHECPPEHAVPLHAAADCLARVRPDVVVIGLAPDPAAALETLNEICHNKSFKILAVGPTSDSKLILQTIRAGAAEYLDENEVGSDLLTALAKLQIKEEATPHAGKVISLLGPSGGSGSSTLAANLASALAKHHAKCALFDMKLESGDLATLLDLAPEHSLAEFCANLARMDGGMFNNCFTRHANGVHLLAAPLDYRQVAQVTPLGIRKALTMARAVFPYVVADLDHSYGPEQAQVLYQSDVVLVVLRQEFTALRQARRALEFLQHSGVPQESVRLVVNRFHRSKALKLKQLQAALNVPIDFCIPDEPKTIDRANNKGVPVITERPRSKVARSILSMAVSVNGAVPATR